MTEWVIAGGFWVGKKIFNKYWKSEPERTEYENIMIRQMLSLQKEIQTIKRELDKEKDENLEESQTTIELKKALSKAMSTQIEISQIECKQQDDTFIFEKSCIIVSANNSRAPSRNVSPENSIIIVPKIRQRQFSSFNSFSKKTQKGK